MVEIQVIALDLPILDSQIARKAPNKAGARLSAMRVVRLVSSRSFGASGAKSERSTPA